MLTLEQAKLAIRQTNDLLDAEIQSTVDAALLDLQSGGMASSADSSLVDMAVRLYLRWQYDYCGKGDQYANAYGALKNVLCLTEVAVDE